jgi:hypothetical protein
MALAIRIIRQAPAPRNRTWRLPKVSPQFAISPKRHVTTGGYSQHMGAWLRRGLVRTEEKVEAAGIAVEGVDSKKQLRSTETWRLPRLASWRAGGGGGNRTR